MQFQTSDISALDNYRLLVGGVTPRPIAWISTQSAEGVNNLAPYSFFSVASCNPPVLMFTQLQPKEGGNKDTLNNLLATNECVINIVNADAAEAMNQTCAALPSTQSEFEFAGVSACASVSVKPLSVADAPVRYECRLREVLNLSSVPAGGTVVLLDVLSIYVRDDLLNDEGAIKQGMLGSVGKMGGDWYAKTTDLFELKRP